MAFVFAALALLRLFVNSKNLDRATLGAGALVLAVTSVTGHAIDDSFEWWQQASFLLHTLAGLTWLGGLIALVWWMRAARDKPPEVCAKLAERWSLIAKIAIVVVLASGLVMAWENVGSFANLLATPYGRLLTLKLCFFSAAMFAALAIVLYLQRRPADAFDTGFFSRVGAAEAVAAVGLVFIAGWIAVITPAAHETELYWPLPFRLSFAATWGYLGLRLPWVTTPAWWTAPAWWGIGALIFIAVGAALWWAPKVRAWRLAATPAALGAALLCIIVSLSTQAYTDTYNDPAVDYTAESITRGHKDFVENCIPCHGVSGEGNGEMAKSLKVQPADLTAPHVGNHTIGDIFHWLSYGGQSGVMPAFKDILGSDDRWDVINYLLVLSYTNQARFIGGHPMVQWLIAPDFQLDDPEDKVTTLYGLRGVPTLVSFARCNAAGTDEAELEQSLRLAAETVKTSGANHVTVYQGGCPQGVFGRIAVHPAAAEDAYAVFNRYANELPNSEISEVHFLIDRSGYVRSRYRHFAPDNGQTAQLAQAVATLAKEPYVPISLHSH